MTTRAQLAPAIYICACGAEARNKLGMGLPKGWHERKVMKAFQAEPETVILCEDCARFEAALASYEGPARFNAIPGTDADTGPELVEGRTHGNDSAVDDAEGVAEQQRPSRSGVGSLRRNLWKITLIFHTDKGTVETTLHLGAPSPLDAAQLLPAMLPAQRKAELVSVIVTPAPLDISQTPPIRPSGLAGVDMGGLMTRQTIPNQPTKGEHHG